MDDRSAFELQLAREVSRMAGPEPRFDALAIARSAMATVPARRWSVVTHRRGGFAVPLEGGSTLRSTVDLVVAGLIVALLGGILLWGILTTPQGDEVAPAAVTESPSPMTTEELLSGMVTEEVEPGVVHILNDAVREIAPLGGGRYWGEAVMVDGAGQVWRIVQLDRYFRLGGEEEWPIVQWTDLAIADGRLVTDFDELSDLLGPGSAAAEELGLSAGLSYIEAQADGTLWLLGDGGSLVRVPPDGVSEVIDFGDVYDGQIDGLLVTPDGEAWLMGTSEVGLNPAEVFLHFDGEGWEIVPVPDEALRTRYGVVPEPDDVPWRGSEEMFDVGPGGALWTVGDARSPHQHLARYDGSGWIIYSETDGVRPWGSQRVGVWNSPLEAVRVAPDGSAWVNATGPGEWGCGGLGRFDGASWASYLPGMCIAYYDIAPDGAVWVVASEPPVDEGIETETFVITPEAASASG